MIAFVIVFAGCGVDRTEAVADIEAMFPTLTRYQVTGIYQTDDCEYLSYGRGTFVTDPASVDCEIDIEGPYPRRVFDRQARADLDAIYAESERFGPKLQHAFPEYGAGDSITGGSFGFNWDRTYVFEPAWTALPPEGSEKSTPINDDWYEISSAVTIGRNESLTNPGAAAELEDRMDSSTPNASTLDRSLAFRVTNPGLAAVRVRVEPWAREYDLPAGSSRDLHLTGPDPARIEVAVMPTEITIYGWAGAVLDGIGLPVPSLPERPDDTPAR